MKYNQHNVILGAGFNYNDFRLYPFLKSLEQTGFKGSMVLFINDQTNISDLLQFKFNVEYINVDKELAFTGVVHKVLGKVMKGLGLRYWWIKQHRKAVLACIKDKQPFSKWLLGFFYHNFYLATARFALYFDWLARYNCDNVFFTDVNDVIFQEDIFLRMNGSKVVAFEEYEGVKLGKDANNAGWIEAGYGEEVLDKIYDATIYCSGTILAAKDICFAFLSDFILELINGRKPVEMIGFDQGIYNYLVSHEKKSYFRSSPNAALVFTAATQPESDIIIKDGHITLKELAQAPAVIHQYNRHKNLMEFIENRFMPV
jgi:hypothetical protein